MTINKIRLQLPNALTCCNLFSGCIASVMVFRNHLDYAAYLIFAAAIFDLFDGMLARKVLSNPHFGKELDSLADIVSFGFVPGAIMFKLLQYSNMEQYFNSEMFIRIIQFFPFVITIFSALRLAKFNIDTRQTNSFIGLPTPANTLFIVSLPLIISQAPGRFDNWILNPYVIVILTCICSFLLVSEIPLFSMKFKTLSLKDNLFQFILVGVSLILFPVLLFTAIPIVIALYVLLSVIENYTKAKS
jgi:CDP-diacylglycerol--serine O-phosphatidyltransferase